MTSQDKIVAQHTTIVTPDQYNLHLVSWFPTGKPRAVFQIVHGMAEYAERYSDFACFLAAKDFVVIAHDHRGHGNSIQKWKGHFADQKGWQRVLDDIEQVSRWEISNYPDLPLIQFGHSMGSILMRNMLFSKTAPPPVAVVLSGVDYTPLLKAYLGNFTARIITLFNETGRYNKTMTRLNFGSANARIPNPKTKNDWLTCDPEVVKKYNEDELCGFHCSPQFYRDITSGVIAGLSKSNLRRINTKVPLLLLSGGEDPVGGYGKGIQLHKKQFKASGVAQVDSILYPQARHELLNELNADQVMGDILTWVNAQLKRAE